MQTSPRIIATAPLPPRACALAWRLLAACACSPAATLAAADVPGAAPGGRARGRAGAPRRSGQRRGALYEQAARRAAPRRAGRRCSCRRPADWLPAGRSAEADARAARHHVPRLTPVQVTERRVSSRPISTLANGQAQQAWQMISAIAEPAGTPTRRSTTWSRMRIALAAARPVDGVRAEIAAEQLAADAAERTRLRAELLAQLRQARVRGVKLEPEASQDPTVRGWLDLGAIAGSTRRRLADRRRRGGALARALSGSSGHRTARAGAARSAAGSAAQLRKVALLLPHQRPGAPQLRGRDPGGFDFALQQLPAASRPQVQVYDTGVLPVPTKRCARPAPRAATSSSGR